MGVPESFESSQWGRGVFVAVIMGAKGLEVRGKSGRLDGKEEVGASRCQIRGCKGVGERTKGRTGGRRSGGDERERSQEPLWGDLQFPMNATEVPNYP